jgi:hypothetical protein
MLIQPLNKIIEKRLSLFFMRVYILLLLINIQQFISCLSKNNTVARLRFEPSEI